MNLKKKKELATKTLKVGKGRILFVEPRLDEIKEAITKQDIKQLKREGAIIIKNRKGRRKIKKRKRKRGYGKIKKRIIKRKKDYATLSRKLRWHIAELKKRGEISKEDIKEIRKKIKNKVFRSKAHLKQQTKTGLEQK